MTIMIEPKLDTETSDVIEVDIISKHRQEKKDLQKNIQEMKKNNKNKNKRKEMFEEIARLEVELHDRQCRELSLLKIEVDSEDEKEKLKEVRFIGVEDKPEKPIAQKPSKAQRKREKKEMNEKARQAQIIEEEKLNKNSPRIVETKKIDALLKARDLRIFSVPSDGDCLYNAVKHQLRITERFPTEVQKLRFLTADYIEANKDSLIFYMTNPETNECLTDEEFHNYCELIRTTKAWGGQIEINALSNVLKVPIEVLQATGNPTIQGADEFAPPNLILTYHRHMYSLGEHYNSTQVVDPSNEEEDEDDNENE